MNRMSILFLALAACGTGTTEPDPDTGDTAASGHAVRPRRAELNAARTASNAWQAHKDHR